MPTKPQKSIPWPGILGGAIILLILVWVGLRGRGGAPVITSPAENNALMEQAASLSLQHLKDVDAGVELNERDRVDLRKAADLFDAASDYRPDNIAPFVGAGKIYLVLGNYDAAETRLRKGLATVPAKGAHPAQLDTASEAHYLLSEVLFRKGDYVNALSEVDQAIALFARSPIYYSQRASILVQLRKYSDAKIAATTALEIENGFPRAKQILKLIALSESDALLKLAKEKLNKKDYQAVVDAATRGVELDPARPAFLALRAAAYIELGRRPLAKADVAKLKLLDPTGEDTKRLEQTLR